MKEKAPLPAGEADRPRRFYQAATAAPADGGWRVLLDARVLRTPAGAPLVTPTQGLAQLVAQEWEAQGETIDRRGMLATRLAQSAIDGGAAAADEARATVLRYAGSDLLCYLADGPRELEALQAARWTPLRDWARESLGLWFEPTRGVLHRPQPPETLARLAARLESEEAFALAGLFSATPLFGSAILALALRLGRLEADEAFALSRLDEAFQEERWGVDVEAAARTAARREEARVLGRWMAALPSHPT